MERILLCSASMVVVEPGLADGTLRLAPSTAARFEQLFVEHYAWVWRTLRRLGVDPAVVDDAAQHVFLIASQRLEQVPTDKERAFLMGVAVRTAANARRAQVRHREQFSEEEPRTDERAASPEELLDWKQRRELLDTWLSALALELRAPFVLFELEGLSLTEIAELLELPLGTVKTRLRKARAIFLEVASAGGAP
jgi:RNA polymerase sigma-70 factor (ECF subfamily)